MSKTFRLSIFQKLLPQSHAHIGELQHVVDAPSTRTVELLEEAVRGHIKSRQEFNSWGEDVDEIDFVVYKVR